MRRICQRVPSNIRGQKVTCLGSERLTEAL